MIRKSPLGALTLVWVLLLCGAPSDAAADSALIVDEKGTELTVVAARIDDKKGKNILRLTLEPVVPLSDKAAQEAAENFFERYVLASAGRYDLDRAMVYVRPLVEMPGGEQKNRLFRFDASDTSWSLENHRPVEAEKPYLYPVGAKLGDGSRVDVERMQRFKMRTREGMGTLLRVEILLYGLNPMAERGNVYLALSQFWSDRLRAKADEEGAVAAEIVAAFEPRARRYAVRDQLGLVIARDPGGAWPTLPALDDELARPTADFSLAAGPDMRFGAMDRGPFDRILAEILDEGPSPPVASADPRM